MPTVERLKLSPPWITYVNKIKALLGHDPDLDDIVLDDKNKLIKTVKIYVENPDKAVALYRLLPEEKNFGNVTLAIEIIPANGSSTLDYADISSKELFDIAFDRNPVYAFCKEIAVVAGYTITYVVFKNRVVQFFADNLNDIYGNISTLYQEVASDIFEDFNGVFFCTDIEEKVGKPLGEWP